QLARQAERQVETADPGPWCAQALAPGVQRFKGLDGLQPHAATIVAAHRQRDRLAPRRRAREIAAEQGEVRSAHAKASAPTPRAMNTAPSKRSARSPSRSRCPPMSAAKSMETSRAGATCDSGARCMANSTST